MVDYIELKYKYSTLEEKRRNAGWPSSLKEKKPKKQGHALMNEDNLEWERGSSELFF